MTSMDDYSAESIRILTDAEAVERFSYVKAQQLAKRYPTVTLECIGRLLEACELVSYPVELAVKRYLDGDTSVKPSAELITAYRELLETANKMDGSS